MNLLFLDFETRSRVNVREVGAYRYAADPSTEVICCAYALDDEPVHLWRPPGRMHEEADFDQILGTGDLTLVAHNIEFEREILKHKFGLDLPVERFIDTAAMAARMSLPRNLEDLAGFFGLDAEVKKEGGKAIRTLHSPNKRGEFWTRDEKPEAYAALEARCVQDVELMRTIYHRLLPLEEKERRIWATTIRMNERGVRVDLPAIPAAKRVLDEDARPLLQEFDALTGGVKLKSYVKLAKVCGLPDVGKSTVRKALRDPGTAPKTRRILEILQGLSKSSVAKLDAMEARQIDGRVKGSFLYCGAERTGRWSSNGVQFQNFKRGLGAETDLAFECLAAGTLDLCFTGAPRPSPDPELTPTGTIAEMLRGFILGPFLVGDMAQIEARVLGWLAGQDDLIETFRNKGDPYCAMAAEIYGHPVTKKEKDKRFMGKQAVLGCGYGLGANGFRFMLDETYDVQVEEDFAKRVVDAYRRKNPRIVAFWDRLGRGFLHAVAHGSKRIRISEPGRPLICAGVLEQGGEKYAFLELPSGRRLYYAQPTIQPTKRGPAVHYYGRERFSKGWTQVHTYGGKIAENITQAVSRDVLAEAMLRLEAAGFSLVMTVHDEVVAEGEADRLEEFERVMAAPPAWAEGLPIEVEAFASRRYRK